MDKDLEEVWRRSEGIVGRGEACFINTAGKSRQKHVALTGARHAVVLPYI